MLWRQISPVRIYLHIKDNADLLEELWLQWNTGALYTGLGWFIGIFAMFVAVTYVSQGVMIWQVMISIVPKSGAGLHKILVDSTLRAPMSFFESTDSSQLVNRFSQDMTLVDGVLPSVVFGVFMGQLLLNRSIIDSSLIVFRHHAMHHTSNSNLARLDLYVRDDSGQRARTLFNSEILLTHV
jgi:ABC-type multidrug transport system fused ATPase/permease subunit